MAFVVGGRRGCRIGGALKLWVQAEAVSKALHVGYYKQEMFV